MNNDLKEALKIVLGIILIVIILGFLAMLYIVSGIHKANIARSCNSLEFYATVIEDFKVDNEYYPTTKEGLQALVSNPDINKYPDYQRRLNRVIVDPWGEEYYYLKTPNGFEVFSFGIDKKIGGTKKNKDIFYPECDKPNQEKEQSWFEEIFGMTQVENNNGDVWESSCADLHDIYTYPNHPKYKEKLPMDPWGNIYYKINTESGFEVLSFGADGKSDGENENTDIFYPECYQPPKSWFQKIFG